MFKRGIFKQRITFIEYSSPQIVIERLFSRVPEEDSVFSNWNTSWWKLQDELFEKMENTNAYQGKRYDYCNGSALRLIK